MSEGVLYKELQLNTWLKSNCKSNSLTLSKPFIKESFCFDFYLTYLTFWTAELHVATHMWTISYLKW